MYFRRLFPLLLLVLLSFTLMTYQTHKGAISPFGLLGTALDYVNYLYTSVSSYMKEPFRRLSVRDEENKRLREEMNKLIVERQKYRDLFYENQRLREILSLKEKQSRYVTASTVISKGMDRWSYTVVIDKGSRDGISKDMAVVTKAGLVGKVSQVSEGFSRVLLLTDINFSAAVKVQDTRKDAILSGTGLGTCILKYITQEETVKENYVIVTSGFDDLFPQDIPVGYVSKVSQRESGVFKYIEVRPFQDVTKLDELVILKR
jgi:rod shape-determining protein MreC